MTGAVDYTDVDDVIVRRVMGDEPHGAPLSPADAAAAVKRLAGLRYSDGQIAYLLGCSRRSVHRIRVRHQIPAGVPRFTNPYTLPVSAPTRPKGHG